MALTSGWRGIVRELFVLVLSRVVNGIETLCLQIEGTITKIPITQYGYYYGGKEGTIQVITFTRQNLFSIYREEFTNFLNGLVVLSK